MKDTFRKEYKALDGNVKDTLWIFKQIAESLEKEFDLADAELNSDKRCMALARTNLEQAIMWATKAIT